MKFIRRFEEGINPGVEVGRFLSERARFPYAPLSGGSVEYRPDAPGSVPTTVAVLEEFISNEDDGWNYVVDALTHSLEEALAHRQDAELRLTPPRSLFTRDRSELEPGHLLVGAHLEWASLLGRRTAELHLALTSDRRDPDFAPEPLTALDRQALYHGARSLTRKVFHECAALPLRPPMWSRCSRARTRSSMRMRKLSMLPITRRANPLPRRLPPRPGALDREGLRHHRLRGRAQSLARPAAAEAARRRRPGRHGALVPLRRHEPPRSD